MTRFEKSMCKIPCDTTILSLEEPLTIHFATSEEKGTLKLNNPKELKCLIDKCILKNCVFITDFNISTWSSLKDVDDFLFVLGNYLKCHEGALFIFESLLWNIYNTAYHKNLFYTSRHTGNPITNALLFKGAVLENAVLEVDLISDLTNDPSVVDLATGFHMITQKLIKEMTQETHLEIECFEEQLEQLTEKKFEILKSEMESCKKNFKCELKNCSKESKFMLCTIWVLLTTIAVGSVFLLLSMLYAKEKS